MPQRRAARRELRARRGHRRAGGLAPRRQHEGRHGKRESEQRCQRERGGGERRVGDLPRQAHRERSDGQAQQHTGAAHRGRLPRGQAHERSDRGAANAQQSLLAAAAVGARGRDGQRHEQREHDPGRTEKQEKHPRIQRIGAHAVQARRQVVGDGGAAGDMGLDVVRQAEHLHVRGGRIRGQRGVVEPNVQLGAHRVGPQASLRVEQRVPGGHRHQQHIVGRCLRGSAFGHADRLEHRIGVRQCDDASDAHIHRRHPDAQHADRVAHRDMQVGRGLGRDQHAVCRAEHDADLIREARGVARFHADDLTGARGLGGVAGGRAQPGAVGIPDTA